MKRGFFDVFPTVKLEGECEAYMKMVQVERISATRARDLYRVYITCERLIEKSVIYKIEKELQEQLFSTMPLPSGAISEVKIYEKFTLSEQYTLRALMESYMDSILLEVRNHSPIIYNMLI